jgi:hypothetical protein
MTHYYSWPFFRRTSRPLNGGDITVLFSYHLLSPSGDWLVGYSPLVDRILRRQKAEREAAEKALTLKDEDVLGSSNLVLSTDRRGVSPSPNANIPGGVTASRTLVTPLSNIGMLREPRHIIASSHIHILLYLANNIDMAIKACTHEKNDLLRNREEMQVVRESLDEGYCDISGGVGDLALVGTCSASSRDSLI